MKRSVPDDVTLVTLNQLNIGKRKLRYMHVPVTLIDGGQHSVNGFCLLFLGGDILNNTSVSTKNMARTHSRFSRNNQCTKILFPSRLAGVAGHTKDAWFYDIHGLLRCVFEFYEYDEQVLVLRYLFHTWTSSEQHLLPSELKLSKENIILDKLLLTVVVKTVDDCQLCKEASCSEVTRMLWNKRSTSTQTKKDSISVACQKHSNTVINMSTQTKNDGIFELYSTGSQCEQNQVTDGCCQTEDMEISKNTIGQNDLLLVADVTEKNMNRKKVFGDKLCEYDVNVEDHMDLSESHMKTNWNSSTRTQEKPSVRLISSLLNKIHKNFQQASCDIIFYKVYTLLEAFLCLVKDELAYIEHTTTGIFPFHLFLEYSALRKAYHCQSTEHTDAEMYYQECVLQVISKWLAKKYNKLQTVITSQIEEFKRNQMQKNKVIPGPVEIISGHNLYPSFMIEFLSTWVGGFQKEEERTFFCSRLLLVLELLNDTLLTGMGHVVYAKLKCNYSM